MQAGVEPTSSMVQDCPVDADPCSRKCSIWGWIPNAGPAGMAGGLVQSAMFIEAASAVANGTDLFLASRR